MQNSLQLVCGELGAEAGDVCSELGAVLWLGASCGAGLGGKGQSCILTLTVVVFMAFTERFPARTAQLFPETPSIVIPLVLQRNLSMAQNQPLLAPGTGSVAEPRFPGGATAGHCPEPGKNGRPPTLEGWEWAVDLCLCLGGGPGATAGDGSVAFHLTPGVLLLWEQPGAFQPCRESREFGKVHYFTC